MIGSSPLGLALLTALAVLLANVLGPLFERIVFLGVARRLWRTSLAGGDATLLGTALTRTFVAVASGPFKAPFGASIVLLSFSGRLPPLAACALLMFLYVLRCVSTSQTHVERPAVGHWRSQHGLGVGFRTGSVWPRNTVTRLARGSYDGLGAFEREDLRAYFAVICLLLSASPELPLRISLAAAACALLLPAGMMIDVLRITLGRPRLSTDSRRRPLPVSGWSRYARVFLGSLAVTAVVFNPNVRDWPPLPYTLTALAVVCLFCAIVLETVGFALGYGAPASEKRPPGNTLVIDPAAVRKARFQRDVGVTHTTERNIPFLRWMTTTYTVTNRRLITRRGIITRSGRDIPLFRINDVAYEKGLLDRLLGCGTLVISDATEKAGVELTDIPNVEQVHLQISDLLFARDDGSDDDGSRVPGEPPRNR